jgi:hypothetical protein
MKVLYANSWSLSPHCWDHIEPGIGDLKGEHRESVVLLNRKTYWPVSLIYEWESILIEAIQLIEENGSWVPTLRSDHKSIAWKLYTHKGIELHLSFTRDDKHEYWIHAYPTDRQALSGRNVLNL